VALVSDAGTPLLSDPGFLLVREAAARGLRVEAIPGPSALLAALVVAGLPPLPFTFAGFAPPKGGKRRTFYARLAALGHTVIVYESPHRIAASLADAAAAMGSERPAVVARELTKLHEEVLRGRASEVLTRLTGVDLKGEVAVVIGGAPAIPTDDVTVFIPEADAIWYHGFSYKRGSIEMNLTSCGDANGCVERLIARLDFEDYLLGLGEVPASWPMAAMQAQAIAARSYAAYDVKHYAIRGDCNCDLSDGASDQTYIGYNREAGTDGSRWIKAVRSTAHQVASYGGNVIQAFYAASDGGHTDSVQDVWHGGNPAYKIAWLTGVCDPGEWTDANPWTAWKKSYSASYVTSRLAPYTSSIGTIKRFRSIHRTKGGRIMSAVAVGTSGSRRVGGDQLKGALGWYDERVWINSDHTIRGAIRHRYDALGCKPGLPTSPQRVVSGGAGAQQFFAAGGMYRNNKADLTLWLHGPIDHEFRAVGAATGVLGLPTSTSTSLLSATQGASCNGCRRISFTGGRIYDGPSTGAHALWGNVLDTYLKHGGAPGALGMPTTRVQNRDGGGVRARFQHGTIVCRHGTCHVS